MILFSEICETTQGVQVSKTNQSMEEIEGYERYLYISDLLHDKNLKYIKNNYPHKVVTINDLVVANTGSPGKVFRGKQGILSNNLFRLSFDSNVANKDYLYFILSSPTFQTSLQKQMKGGIQKHLGHKTMGKQKIPLPPLEQQKKIAAILDTADAYRQKTKALITKYEELTQSLFLDMFGDVSDNIKYKKGCVGDIVTIVRDGPHVSPKYSESGVPILSTRNIRPYELIMKEVKYVSQDLFQDLTKRIKPEKGDILLTKGGTTGYAKVVDWDWDFCIWVHLAILRLDTKKANPKYLEAGLNSYFGYHQSQLYTRGIANKDLGLKRLIKIEIPIPPLNLQNQFAERVQAIEAQKTKAQASLVQAEDLFNSLLQKAFKGELVH